MVVISVYTYGVKIIKKIRWESGFLWGGGPWNPPPLCTNGSAGYLMQLSVKLKLNCYYQGFWIYLYFRIRHSFAHLRPVILSADWLISRLQSWTCSSLPTVAEFVKLTQSIDIEIQRQSADLYKVQLCNR